jgi:hypothetical protein
MRPFRLVLAGAAGGRVGTAARLLCRAAVLSDLFAAGRRDYPVTVKTGYSLAEVVLSPAPIEHATVTAADALLVLAPEGRAQAAPYLPDLAPGARIVALAGIDALTDDRRVVWLDPMAAPGRLHRDLIATTMAAAVALRLDLVPVAALRAAVEGERHVARIGAALDTAEWLARQAP